MNFFCKSIVIPLLLLSGCGYQASLDAHRVQSQMIGMSESDLLACAGIPTKAINLNNETHVFSYTLDIKSGTGLSINLPMGMGGVNLGSAGQSCDAIVKVYNNTVTDVHYTGIDDHAVGEDGVCAPIFQGCYRQPESTMKPITHSSAFIQNKGTKQPIPSETVTGYPPSTK